MTPGTPVGDDLVILGSQEFVDLAARKVIRFNFYFQAFSFGLLCSSVAYVFILKLAPSHVIEKWYLYFQVPVFLLLFMTIALSKYVRKKIFTILKKYRPVEFMDMIHFEIKFYRLTGQRYYYHVFVSGLVTGSIPALFEYVF